MDHPLFIVFSVFAALVAIGLLICLYKSHRFRIIAGALISGSALVYTFVLFVQEPTHLWAFACAACYLVYKTFLHIEAEDARFAYAKHLTRVANERGGPF